MRVKRHRPFSAHHLPQSGEGLRWLGAVASSGFLDGRSCLPQVVAYLAAPGRRAKGLSRSLGVARRWEAVWQSRVSPLRSARVRKPDCVATGAGRGDEEGRRLCGPRGPWLTSMSGLGEPMNRPEVDSGAAFSGCGVSVAGSSAGVHLAAAAL